MSSLSWKIRQLFQKSVPYLLVALVCYTGYSMYRHGALRRGVGPAFSSMVRGVPILGSHFRHFRGFSGHSRSYAYSKRHYRRHGRRGRARHHRRHHRR